MSFKEQGDFYFRNDRYEEALGFYQKALLLDKENPFLQYRVAECRISIDQNDSDFAVEAQHAKDLLQRNLNEANDLLDASDDLLGTVRSTKKHRSYLDINNNISNDEISSNIDVEALKQVRERETKRSQPVWKNESLRPYILTAAGLAAILLVLTSVYIFSDSERPTSKELLVAAGESVSTVTSHSSIAVEHLIAQAEEFENDGNYGDALVYYGRVLNYQPENQRILSKIRKVKNDLSQVVLSTDNSPQFEGRPRVIDEPGWELDAAYQERIRFDRWREQQEYLLENYELRNTNNTNVSVNGNESSLQMRPISEVFENLSAYSEAKEAMYYDTVPENLTIARQAQKPSSITPTVLPSQQIVFDPEIEAQPRFGSNDLKAVLKENLLYPFEARKKGIQGRVLLQFIVESNGSLSNIKALSQLGGGCEQEAQRLLKLTKWVPAKSEGHAVRSLKELSIDFSLK